MDRLTKRDKKGRAYFDNDGVLIRGANGTFHQKKDMTAHYIHDRFVALDKAIGHPAAYEDTGLGPEEIMALKEPPNDPLTMEELRGMSGEPVWCEEYECWGIVKCDTVGVWANKPFLVGVWETRVNFEYDIEARGLTLYRRKPGREQNER